VNDEGSAALFARAQRVTPGGVNSPVRAFGAVGGTPRFIVRGEGPYVIDADGNRYVDLVGAWGPALLVTRIPAGRSDAVRRRVNAGSDRMPTRRVELAELIVDRVARSSRCASSTPAPKRR